MCIETGRTLDYAVDARVQAGDHDKRAQLRCKSARQRQTRKQIERTMMIDDQKIVLSFWRGVVHRSEGGVKWNQKIPYIRTGGLALTTARIRRQILTEIPYVNQLEARQRCPTTTNA